MKKELETLREKAEDLFEQEKYKEIIDLLSDEILDKHRDAALYAWRARAHYRLNNDPDIVMHYAQKSVDQDSRYFMGYSARGNAWYDKSEYDKSIVDYTQTTELNPDFFDAYYNRGNAWRNKGDYDKAIADYTKAIALKPEFAFTYINRGVSWFSKSENDKALTDYSKAISLKPDLADTYYNRALLNRLNEAELSTSLRDFEKFLELTTDKNDIWAIRAKDFILELKEKLKDRELKEIGDITSNIKKLLLISDGCITHYTGLSVTRILLFDDKAKFRLSEGAFLNDTSEGTELSNSWISMPAPSREMDWWPSHSPPNPLSAALWQKASTMT